MLRLNWPSSDSCASGGTSPRLPPVTGLIEAEGQVRARLLSPDNRQELTPQRVGLWGTRSGPKGKPADRFPLVPMLVLQLPTPPASMELAACRGLDTELFFPLPGGPTAEAVATSHACRYETTVWTTPSCSGSTSASGAA